jgi:putative transposase
VQTEKKQRRPLDELELKTFGESSSVERIKLESGYIGVDRNATGHVAVIAVNNKIVKLGKNAYHTHKKYQHIRKNAQKNKHFKFVKKLKNKESRIVKDINHKISKKIVNIAAENNYAIKLEKLTGIRKKKQSKILNNIKSNWAFYQLEQFIEYKAKLLGVKVLYVDPAYTSQTCSRCGLIGNRNKKSFKCSCGHNDHADANASFNIAKASIIHDRSIIDRDIIESKTDIAEVEII